MVSDKRVYFRGTTYWVQGKKLRKMAESKTVDLKDVMGTSVTYFENLWMKIVGWLLTLIGSIAMLVVAFAAESIATFLAIAFMVIFILGLRMYKKSATKRSKKKKDGEFLPSKREVGELLAGFGGVALVITLVIAFGQILNKTVDEGWNSSRQVQAVETEVALLVFGVFLAGVAFHIAYLFTRINLLKIEYAGGCIGFDIAWFPMAECTTYQKQLRLAKDKAVEESENATANAVTSAMSQMAVAQPVASVPATSNADELFKYADLMDKGLITREEFDEIKAGLLKK